MLARLPEENIKKMESGVQFPKRLGRPEEFAHAVLFLIESSYMNGETVRLDGGVRLAAL
jgi:NAD(P)-dependent dehydrogenase (short-subunit alcohol dehydrogenase family)